MRRQARVTFEGRVTGTFWFGILVCSGVVTQQPRLITTDVFFDAVRCYLIFFQDHKTDTLKLLVDVATADDNEDVAVSAMSDEDAERMLQR